MKQEFRLLQRLELSRNCDTCKHRTELHKDKISCVLPEYIDEDCYGEHYEWDGVSE